MRDDSHNGASRAVRVLLIDADEGIRSSAASLLARSDWQIEVAADGFEGLASVAARRPDIIFADVMAPRLNGYQTCALIKSNPDLRLTPVVLVCDASNGLDGARGKLVGCDDRMTRPYVADQVAALVEQHVSGREAEAAGAPDATVEPTRR